MINGRFQNCYGIKELNLPNIDFSNCHKALIYAPNGVMKSSLAKVFEDISNGSATRDRILLMKILLILLHIIQVIICTIQTTQETYLIQIIFM